MTTKFTTKLTVTCLECGAVVIEDTDADLDLKQAAIPKQTLGEHATESAGHHGEVTYSAVFCNEAHIVLDPNRRRFKITAPEESAVGKAQMLFRQRDLPGEET